MHDQRPARIVIKPHPQPRVRARDSSQKLAEVGGLRSSKAEVTDPRGGPPLGWTDDVAARVEQECAEQGIPVGIDDPVTIAKIITLVRAGRASKSATTAARSERTGRPSSSAKGR